MYDQTTMLGFDQYMRKDAVNEEFTLEKLKISERLTILETKHDSTEIMIKDIHTAVMGSNGTTGLRIEVDRLKQDKKNNEKHWFVIYTGLVGMVIKTLWEMIVRKP